MAVCTLSTIVEAQTPVIPPKYTIACVWVWAGRRLRRGQALWRPGSLMRSFFQRKAKGAKGRTCPCRIPHTSMTTFAFRQLQLCCVTCTIGLFNGELTESQQATHNNNNNIQSAHYPCGHATNNIDATVSSIQITYWRRRAEGMSAGWALVPLEEGRCVIIYHQRYPN